jgi:hypothetical protein
MEERVRDFEVWTRTVAITHVLTKRGALVLSKMMTERYWKSYPTVEEARAAVIRLTVTQGGIFYVKGDDRGEERLPGGGECVPSVPTDADAGIGQTDGTDDDTPLGYLFP